MVDSEILGSATRLASYNMVLQLFFRLLTFGLNGFILRFITKDVLGIVNVRLTLLYTTILFVAREAFRRACLSIKGGGDKWTQVINLLWCTVPIGFLTATVLRVVWIYLLEQPDSTHIPHYNLAVTAFAESAVIELLAEPLYVVGQVMHFVKLRVFIEGIALAFRCALTVILVLVFPSWGLVPFALAQIAFTCLYSIMYYSYFTYYLKYNQDNTDLPFKTWRDFFPKIPHDGQQILSYGLTNLTWSFFKQSFLKQLLTEGERYVMTVFGVLSFADQGVYDVVNNLGSLAARFIFLPIEDSAYLLFSQSMVRGKQAKEQNKESMDLVSGVLECLLKIVTLIGLIIFTFGYAYSYLLLDLYGGRTVSGGSGPQLLRWFCSYVLLIAINGVTESFVFACMGKDQVDSYNKKMLLFSVVFLSSSWLLTRWLGSIGFVLANCFNMAVRIAHSVLFTRRFFLGSSYQPLLGILPSVSIVVVLAMSFLITSYSEIYFTLQPGFLPRIYHIGVGGSCLLSVIATIYLTESRLINFVKTHYYTPDKED